MFDCGTKTETTGQIFLRFPFFVAEKHVFGKHFSLQNLNEESMIDIILYGCDRFNECDSKEILLHKIDYLKSTKRFERPLIDHCLL